MWYFNDPGTLLQEMQIYFKLHEADLGLSVIKISLRVLACLVVMFDTAAFLFLMPYCIILFKKMYQLLPVKSFLSRNCLVGIRGHRFLRRLMASFKCLPLSVSFTSHFIPLTLVGSSWGRSAPCVLCAGWAQLDVDS